VWQKKLHKEGKSDLAQAELEKIQKTKMMESKVYLFYSTGIYCLYVGLLGVLEKYTSNSLYCKTVLSLGDE